MYENLERCRKCWNYNKELDCGCIHVHYTDYGDECIWFKDAEHKQAEIKKWEEKAKKEKEEIAKFHYTKRNVMCMNCQYFYYETNGLYDYCARHNTHSSAYGLCHQYEKRRY